MHDVAEFLHRHPPFDQLDEAALQLVSAAVEIEFHAGGTTVLEQGAGSDFGYVVRSGSVDLLDDGTVVDHRGVGESFGLPSMLTGAPARWQVRSAEDLLVYRVPGPVLVPLLSAPPGLRFVLDQLRPTSSSGDRLPSASSSLRAVLRPAVVLAGGDSVADAARRMGEEGASTVLVRWGAGQLGIVTDSDLRRRVLAEGRDPGTRLDEVMTPSALTVQADVAVEDALLLMLDRSVRHLPVVTGAGEVLGVVEDVDLLAAEGQSPFRLRRAVMLADSFGEVERLAALVPRAVVSLYDSGLSPERVTAARSVLVESMCRRLTELAVERLGPAPVPFSWLVLGSTGRRESFPSSDADTALAWEGDDGDATTRAWMDDLAGEVIRSLARCGVSSDQHGVVAADARFARSVDLWRRSVRQWVAQPEATDAVTYVSALLDGRAASSQVASDLPGYALATARADRGFVQVMARLATSRRPPTGFVRLLVVDQAAEHRGRLDLKRAALTPLVDLARYGAVVAGSTALATPQRLRDAAAAGALAQREVDALLEVFGILSGLRLQTQVAALREGREANDLVEPKQLTPLLRHQLRECFQVVAQAQQSISASPWR